MKGSFFYHLPKALLAPINSNTQAKAMRKQLLKKYYDLLEWLLSPLAGRSISANAISCLSLMLSFIAFFMYAKGLFCAGGVMLLMSGFADTMDGTIARLSGTSSKFGALLDSSLDRWSDFFIYAGLLIYYRQSPVIYAVLLCIIGSFMVSYVKARAESLGRVRVVGLMQRPERVVLLAVASFSVPVIACFAPSNREAMLIAVLYLMAILTNITFLHRLFAAKKDLGQEK